MANTAETDTNMSDLTPLTPIIERGLSLHKLIRYGLRINVTIRTNVHQFTCPYTWGRRLFEL